MNNITIEHPHGYLLDSDGEVVIRFANWSNGDHIVQDAVESVEYVDDPSAHKKSVSTAYRSQP